MVLRKNQKQAGMTVIAGCLLAVFLGIKDGRSTASDSVTRQEPGEGSEEKEYILEAEGILADYPWTVTVEERKLATEEKKEIFSKAQEELEQQILGANKSLEEINRDLYLPTTLQDGIVKVEYSFSDYKIFYPDGTIRELPQKAEVMTISAEMQCQEETSIYEFAIQVVPLEKGSKELLIKNVETVLERENEKSGEKKLTLPKEIDGVRLSWKEKTENRSLPVAVLGMVAAGCILASEKEKEKKVKQERERQLQMEYPKILGKLILLMGAGMNVAMAWKRIAEVYRKRREEGNIPEKPAYEEMLIAVYEMQDGIGEIQAYKNFGERCQIAEYRKLAAILVQNVKKGNTQIQRILEEEKTEAYEKHKARVKIAGEEAGTKLLFPMLLMLLVVLVIIMVPAGMSMNL